MLVVLSTGVAIISAWLAVHFAARAAVTHSLPRMGWILASTVSLETGVWGMHFLVPPLFSTTSPLDLRLLALSLLPAIMGASAAEHFVRKATRRSPTLVLFAVGMGIAVGCMHRIAMAATGLLSWLLNEPAMLVSSMGMALVSSLATVWLTYRLRDSVAATRARALKGATAVFIGLAITGAHYTDMAIARAAASGSPAPALHHSPFILVFAGLMLVAAVTAAWAMFVEHRLTGVAELDRLAAIVSSSNDAIMSANRDGVIRSWNRGAERLYGYTAAEMKGRSASVLSPTGDSTELRAFIARVRAGEIVENFETVRRCKDGRLIDVSIALSPIRDSDGRTIGIATTTRDVSERLSAQRIAQEARVAAEAANRAKSEFLANMSHEIRTPMNGVLGMLDLALDTDLRPEQRDYIGTARSSAESLLTLINDILDFSKIEAGKMTLEFRPFELRPFLTEFLRPLEFRASVKGLRLSVDVNPEIPQIVVGDVNRIRQILINLVGNAIKFTTVGEVALRVEADTGAAPMLPGVPLHLHFTIRDTGIGIPADKQRAIFEAFVQADASTTREHGGTGLGLAIAAKLVSIMGGHIRVESEVGEGSTFHLTLLLKSADDLLGRSASAIQRYGKPVTPSAGHPTIDPLRILLADDNLVNQKFLGTLLTKRNHKVVVASNGREVLETMTKADFDLILMDVHMPELSGFETTALIRAMEAGTGRHMPIIAVTARAMVGDRERCLEAGMDDYLSKPIHLGSLYQALARWSPESVSAKPASVPAAPTLDTNTLLSVVDGDHALLAELVSLFSSESPRLMTQIRDAVERNDGPELRDAAHALKGSASSMALPAVAAAAGRLERIGMDRTLNDAPPVVRQLEDELLRSIGALNTMTGAL